MNFNFDIDKNIFEKRIGVLMGGCSSERNISIKSGTAVYNALKESGCSVLLIDIVSEDENEVVDQLRSQEVDLAFIALHGRFGEDGIIQKILEKLRIPYSGSGPAASRIAINKILTYEAIKEKNVQVSPYIALSSDTSNDYNQIIKKEFSGESLIVKPCSEGSSIGINIINNYNNLNDAITKAFCYDKEVIVEQYISGREFTVGIIGSEPLPVVEICSKNSFFDFSAKYEDGETKYIVPAQIGNDIAENMQKIAKCVHEAVGCVDLSRTDFILGDDGVAYVLEVNTIPGMTNTSLLPKAALAIGIDFKKLCLILMSLTYGKTI